MGSVEFLLDSDTLINVLNTYSIEAFAFLTTTPASSLAISLISWIEVLAGTNPLSYGDTEHFLSGFPVLGVTNEAARRAVEVRKRLRVKLPDAIIYATALSTGRTLVTFNKRDFPAGTPSVHLLSRG